MEQKGVPVPQKRLIILGRSPYSRNHRKSHRAQKGSVQAIRGHDHSSSQTSQGEGRRGGLNKKPLARLKFQTGLSLLIEHPCSHSSALKTHLHGAKQLQAVLSRQEKQKSSPALTTPLPPLTPRTQLDSLGSITGSALST